MAEASWGLPPSRSAAQLPSGRAAQLHAFSIYAARIFAAMPLAYMRMAYMLM